MVSIQIHFHIVQQSVTDWLVCFSPSTGCSTVSLDLCSIQPSPSLSGSSVPFHGVELFSWSSLKWVLGSLLLQPLKDWLLSEVLLLCELWVTTIDLLTLFYDTPTDFTFSLSHLSFISVKLEKGVTIAQGLLLESILTAVLIFSVLILAVEKHKASEFRRSTSFASMLNRLTSTLFSLFQLSWLLSSSEWLSSSAICELKRSQSTCHSASTRTYQTRSILYLLSASVFFGLDAPSTQLVLSVHLSSKESGQLTTGSTTSVHSSVHCWQ